MATPPMVTGEAAIARLCRRTQRNLFLLAIVGALVFLVGWAALAVYVRWESRQALSRAELDTGNLAVALEEETERTIKGVDELILFMKADLEKDGGRIDLNAWKDMATSMKPLALQISVIGPDGRLLANSQDRTTEGMDLSDRAHFRVHLTSPNVGLYISRPVTGRVSARRSIQLTRRYDHPDGSMAGVIVVSLDAAYIESFLRKIDIGRHGVVELVVIDGISRARGSLTPVDAARLSRPHETIQRALLNSSAGSFIEPSPIDGIRRIYSYRKVDDLPLVVLVARSMSEVEAELLEANRHLIEIGYGLSIVIVVLFGWLICTLERKKISDVQLLRSHALLAGLNRELRESEQQLVGKTMMLETTLEHMDQGIFVIDKDGTIPVWNHKLSAILDLPVELLASRPRYEQILQHQHKINEFADTPPALIEQVLKSPRTDEPWSYERRRPDGRWVEVRSAPLPSGGAVRTFTDTTQRRNAELESERAREEAETASRVRSSFLATMSHEIRTPLNGVIGLADLLSESPLDERQRQYVKTLQGSADHLLNLISDVLDFSKIDTENLRLEHAGFDVRELVQIVVSLLNPRAVEKGLALTTVIDPAIPARLVGDSVRLRQVLLNLASNAVKFTETGSVLLQVRGERREGDAIALTFSVDDTGIGIADDEKSKLFREFHQIDGTITRRYGGTGLGLAISRRLVRLMGGDIDLTSTPGLGSRFSFTILLPEDTTASDDATTAGSDEPSAEGAALRLRFAGRRPRILLAEDNPTNQLVARSMLESEGCTVDIAETGLQAIAAVGEGAYDLVLMDMMMPELDGLQATRRIRAMENGRDLPIFALTANAFSRDEDACREAGMNGYLSKPVTRRKIRRALLEGLGDARADARAESGTCGKAAAADPVLDDAVLDELETLYGAALDGCLDVFLEETEGRLRRMADGSENGAFGILQTEAHTLKGASLTFGCRRLGMLASSLEAAAEAADVAAIARGLTTITAAFVEARRHLEKRRSSPAPVIATESAKALACAAA